MIRSVLYSVTVFILTVLFFLLGFRASDSTNQLRWREEHPSYFSSNKELLVPNDNEYLTHDQRQSYGRYGPIIDILQKANVTITDDLLQELPTWSDVTQTYGPKPIIKGLDTCQDYRATIPASKRLVGPTGLQNTGTNLLAGLLHSYCVIPERYNLRKDNPKFQQSKAFKTTGMMDEVPWGKHKPFDLRGKVINKSHFSNVKYERVLPIVLIKHPYSWMSSMCRHPYTVRWPHGDNLHCPNLIPNEHEADMDTFVNMSKPIPIQTPLSSSEGHKRNKFSEVRHYDSLTEMWNEWYHPYYEKEIDSFPRLMIRFEDLLFHTESVLTQVCECAGGQIQDEDEVGPIHLNAEPAKHGSYHRSYSKHDDKVHGLVGVLKQYGHLFDVDGSSMTKQDVEYANRSLRHDLVSYFRYELPDVPNSAS